LQVFDLTCPKARLALQRGSFDITPGGPLFTTSGFSCQNPILPRLAFTVCRHDDTAFRFYSFAEPGASAGGT
jgi:hypothetical protein